MPGEVQLCTCPPRPCPSPRRQDGGGVSALVCTGTTSPRQLVAGGGVRYTYIIYTRHGGKKHGTGDGGTKVFLKFVRT